MNTVTDNDKITRNIVDKSIKQKEQLKGYEQKFVPEHPYCTNWPVNKKMDRFDLEEQIQNVWQTKEDLDAVTERIVEDTVFMTKDQISNVLIGISELHETRMWKLWQIFETMVREKSFGPEGFVSLDYRGVPLTEDDNESKS